MVKFSTKVYALFVLSQKPNSSKITRSIIQLKSNIKDITRYIHLTLYQKIFQLYEFLCTCVT